MAELPVERRRHKRYAALPGARVEFSQPRMFNLVSPRVVRVAAMVDISRSGLAFQYEGQDMWSTDFGELTIRNEDDQVRVDKVTFKVISDRVASPAWQTVPAAAPTRRCGIQFTKLTSQAQSGIDRFIRGHDKGARQAQERPR